MSAPSPAGASPSAPLPQRLIVAAFQWDISRDDPRCNLEAVDRLFETTRNASLAPALVLFPEMWSRSFCGRHLPEEASHLDERLAFCAERARRFNCWIGAGTLPEPAGDGKVFNTFFLLDATGTVRLTYRKLHLYPNTSEPRYFARGTVVPEPVVSGPWIIGAGICFDLRFPELFRRQVRRGANLFLCPVQFPQSGAEILELLSRARALENQAAFVTANRCGREGPHSFCGASAVIDPRGRLLAVAEGEEYCVITELSAAKLGELRQEHPYLAAAHLLDEQS